jgi:hypothetical protein
MMPHRFLGASPDPRAQIASHDQLREIKATYPPWDWPSFRKPSSKIDQRKTHAKKYGNKQ